MNKRECVKKIAEYFADKREITTVYLFGSVVKGKATQSSDVDIAILFVPSLDLLHRFDMKLEISNDLEDILGKKVDIVDLESADVFFIHQVMLNKEIVLDKNIERRVSFEVEKRRTYFDRQRFYRLYHYQALKRLDEKGRELRHG